MKINRLYTSPQYGKYLNSLSIRQFCILENIKNSITEIECDAMKYRKRLNYDLILESVIKEEMILNKVEKPSISIYEQWKASSKEMREEITIDVQCSEFQEAEKKVIFKGLKYSDKCLFWTKDNKTKILGGQYKSIDDINMTLVELAEKTNGELELKNIEI